MKWLAPEGSTQRSKCGRYMVVRANSQHWVAYSRGLSGNAYIELGTRHGDEQARACCYEHALRERRP